MILSSIITPVRIYNDYSELDKFKKDCEMCEYELISDKTRLLPFQFQRNASVYPITSWLRKTCNDFYNRIIPYNEANFISTNTWTLQFGAVFENQTVKLVTTLGGGQYSRLNQTTLITVGNRYRVKIIVADKKCTSPNVCDLWLENGLFNNILNINAIGTHIFEFTATQVSLSLQSLIDFAGDYYRVSEFSIYEINEFSLAQGDYPLPNNLLEIINIGTKDIVTYCGQEFESTLPCGKYYLIMQSFESGSTGIVPVYYFSEVITIKNFIPDQSPYVKIEWYNTCDLQKVKYTGLNCDYINRLYVDGPITTPEYPFTEEVEEDGNQNSLPTFQKLEKQEVIIVPKAPEFLIDSLTAMRLHDTIKYFECLRNGQEEVDEFIEVESLTYDLDFVINDCAANVSLKMLLKDRVIDSSCCQEIPNLTPPCCQYSFFQIGNFDTDIGYAMTFIMGVYRFYIWDNNNDVWNELINPPNGTFACDTSTGNQYYWDAGNGVWVETINLSTLVDTGTGFSFTATILPNSVGQVKIIYLGVETILGYYTSAQLLAGLTILYASIPIVPANGEILYVSILSRNAFCDYGESETETLLFEIDP